MTAFIRPITTLPRPIKVRESAQPQVVKPSGTLAESNARKALHEDARTHLGRMFGTR
jgi:hypothetical protein